MSLVAAPINPLPSRLDTPGRSEVRKLKEGLAVGVGLAEMVRYNAGKRVYAYTPFPCTNECFHWMYDA